MIKVSRLKAFFVSPAARTISLFLTIASVLFLGIWFYQRRADLLAVQWASLWSVLVLLVAMYGLSLVLNFVVWHSYLSTLKRIPWTRDLYLYAYSNLSRRLPSSLTFFLVRMVHYGDAGIEPEAVWWFSGQELFFQIATGVLVALVTSFSTISTSVILWFILVLALVPLVLAVYPVVLARLKRASASAPSRLPLGTVLGWMLAYLLSWINGGLMLYILVSRIVGPEVVGLRLTLGMWSFSGALGLLGSLIPLGQYVREASLLLLLQPYVPLPLATASAVVFRLVLMIGDVVWSLILLVLGRLLQKDYCNDHLNKV